MRFADLSRARIGAPLRRRPSQSDLSQRLGSKEQQIQHYEATDYASAKLSRLRAVMHALGVELQMESVVVAGEGGEQ